MNAKRDPFCFTDHTDSSWCKQPCPPVGTQGDAQVLSHMQDAKTTPDIWAQNWSTTVNLRLEPMWVCRRVLVPVCVDPLKGEQGSSSSLYQETCDTCWCQLTPIYAAHLCSVMTHFPNHSHSHHWCQQSSIVEVHLERHSCHADTGYACSGD